MWGVTDWVFIYRCAILMFRDVPAFPNAAVARGTSVSDDANLTFLCEGGGS